jgi:DNA-binding response OmpR family regulator
MDGEINFESVLLTQIKADLLDSSKEPLRSVVLVVDDERIIADTLGAILGSSGYTAMTAYDGLSALEIAAVIPPDLLISDVSMPGMTGIELAILLRQSVPDCNVLLFSGQTTTVDLLAVARAAGYDFTALTKPVHPRDMLARVSELVPQNATESIA